jgi:hypothetical protein
VEAFRHCGWPNPACSWCMHTFCHLKTILTKIPTLI